MREALTNRQRRVADHQRGARSGGVRDGFVGGATDEPRRQAARTEDQSRQDHAGLRGEVERELGRFFDGALRHDDHAPHAAPRADGRPAHEPHVSQRRRGSDGHERDVRFVFGDLPRHLGGEALVESHARVGLQPEGQRPRVQVAHRRHAQHFARAHDAPRAIARWSSARRSFTFSAASGDALFGYSRTTL